MADALFSMLPDGRFLPGELSRGPWSAHALHGGPVAALLARELARVPAPAPMHPARLTVELLRPVPLEPLAVRTEVARPGRKVQLVDAFLLAGPTELARARLLNIRSDDVPLPASVDEWQAPPFPGPGELQVVHPSSAGETVAFHSHATEHRAARGAWSEPGPVTDWIRLRCPVVAGEPLTPLERVAAVADFGNGVSWVLPFTDYLFINPDLTIHLNRLPAGEWVCLDAITWPSSGGVGIAESALWDERGRIGRAVQSLLLERR